MPKKPSFALSVGPQCGSHSTSVTWPSGPFSRPREIVSRARSIIDPSAGLVMSCPQRRIFTPSGHHHADPRSQYLALTNNTIPGRVPLPDGLFVTIAGCSGVGKNSVIKELLADPAGWAGGREVVSSISMTTRAPRVGETDGVDYYFVTRDLFLKEIDAGNLLEWAEYAGSLYGTPANPIQQALASGHIVIADMEVVGVGKTRQHPLFVSTDHSCHPQATRFLDVFIVPPGQTIEAQIAVLRDRIQQRGGGETDAVIDKRMARALEELAGDLGQFTLVVENREVATTVAMIRQVILRHLWLPPVTAV